MSFFSRMTNWFMGERRSALPLRDPALAEFWGGGSLSSAGLSVTPRTAMANPAFGACVRLLADTIATVPLDFFERKDAESRERAQSHPLYQVMQAPNEWQTGVDFRRHLVTQMLCHGNAYARIVRDGKGAIKSLEPLCAERVAPFRASTGRVWYRYVPEMGPAETIGAGEILHLKGQFPTEDGLKGQSPVDLYRDTIGLAQAQVLYLAKFFNNSAVPKGAIEIPGTLGDKAAEVLRSQWERRHAGAENAHRLAILDGGMKFKELGMSHNDAQVVEQYRESVMAIAAIFGIPPHMIGATEKSTSWGTGIEQQSIGFITFVVRPYYVAIEAALNRALMSAQDRAKYYFEFNADGLLRGDFKSRMDGFALMIQWGIATPNEVRRIMNMAPQPGGDSRLQPLNMAPTEIVKDVLMKNSGTAARALRMLSETLEDQDHERTH